ncbi:hypothetical protein N665_3219s0003 [Sinapis alba]|nr:hypothetical protein N665_3219s0003 [Sinapis alba]
MTVSTFRMCLLFHFPAFCFLSEIRTIVCLLIVSNISTKDSEKLVSVSSHDDMVPKKAQLQLLGFLCLKVS